MFQIFFDFTNTWMIFLVKRKSFAYIISKVYEKADENLADFVLISNQFIIFRKNNIAETSGTPFRQIWLNSFPKVSDFAPPIHLS